MTKDDIYGSGQTSNNNQIPNYVRGAIAFGKSTGLIFEESKVQSFLDCEDEINLLEKKKWAYGAQNEALNNSYAQTEGDLVAPFTAISSSVTTGYNKQINTDFKPGFGIENLHTDSYIQNEIPLQSPFTQQFVGGKQSRHVPFNRGTDTPLTRPEAWSLGFQTTPTALKFTYQPVNHPRAVYYRDLIAKRPVNIANIKNDASLNRIGNYSKDYEIVQTNGRYTNNMALVKSGGFDLTEIPSVYVAGMSDYAKPQRGRHEFVFVNRFSSPGSPDTAGDSNGGPGLDPASAEFSPYNNLNYRNSSVRWINNLLLASHVNQFGFYSDDFGWGAGPSEVNPLNYVGTGSIYQVNRNPIQQLKYSGASTVTGTVYDNYWVQHPIPRTDKQYAWITASYISYDTYGYLPYAGDVSSSSGEISLVTFSSASDFVSKTFPAIANSFGVDKTLTSDVLLPTVYNGLNYNVYEPIEFETGFSGFEQQGSHFPLITSYLNTALVPSIIGDGEAALLNAILLKRNGPYQHPTWKQIRTADTPVVQEWKNTNITAYNIFPGEAFTDNNGLTKTRKAGPLKVLRDPPVVSKYKPLRIGLKTTVEDDTASPPYVSIETIKLRNTYGNNMGQFANKEVTQDICQKDLCDDNSTYRAILQMYTNGALNQETSPIEGLDFLSYSEQVYPAAINCYSRINRERVEYKNTFWKDSRLARTTLGESKNNGRNSQDIPRSQSSWALDASQEFGDPSGSIAYSGLGSFLAWNYITGSSGELQNDYTFYWRYSNTLDLFGTTGSLKPSPIISRKQEVVSMFSVVGPSGMQSIVNDCTSSTYLSAYEEPSTNWPIGHVLDRGGNAKFEADKFAGKIIDETFVSSAVTPFYDKYEQYNLNMRLKNKDMSVIPEFRISQHINKYLNDSNGFISENTASFEIVGVTPASTQTVSYVDTNSQTNTYTIKTANAAPQNSSEDDFYNIYSFSDFMNYVDVLEEDHKEFDISQTLTLSCKALMKFIPYDGFYPAERTLDIANAFSRSYGDYIECTSSTTNTSDSVRVRPIYESMFSPGILFNTIKSGVAVDYPIYTGSYDLVSFVSGASAPYSDLTFIKPMLGTGSSGNSGFDYRVNFETLLHPEQINGIPFVDMNPSDLIGLNITSSLNGAPGSNNEYKLMINNFLGEVPEFFLGDLTTAKSQMEDTFTVSPSTSYAMRVKMYRSMNMERISPLRYPIPQDDPLQAGLHETITMYSRPSSFGPPVAGTDRLVQDYRNCDSNGGLNPSFTPPYYNGECWADILYSSGNHSGSVTLDEIFASASVYYHRIWPSTNGWTNTSPSDLRDYPMNKSHANKFAMQLSASVNLFRKEEKRWVIQTKFETPILNFGDTTKRPLNFENLTLPSTGSGDVLAQIAGYGGQTSTPIGMWHQFGLIPEENEGIYLKIEDWDVETLKYAEAVPYTSVTSVESLTDLVGFDKTARKLGTLRDTKTVYEAIVAMPFIEGENKNKTFFKIAKRSANGKSIKEKMNKYVFPPQFDWVRNKKAKALAMYVFEFNHTFDRDDLSHIWQNVSPEFGTRFQESVVSLSHPLVKGEMLSSLSGEIKWMLFKVKQRAETSYYSNIAGAPKTTAPLFSYNWPYDYFSMVEFAKMDATVEFGKEFSSDSDKKRPQATTLVRKSLQQDLVDTSVRTPAEIMDINSGAEKSVRASNDIRKREADLKAFDHQDTDTSAFDHQDKE